MKKYRYDILSGAKKIKTKVAIVLTAAGLLFGGGGISLTLLNSAQAATPNWVMNPASTIDFVCGGSNYVHTVDTVVQGVDGDFTGTGHYNADPGYTWDADGNVSGDDLTLNILYTGTSAGSEYNLVGTVAADGSVSGTVDSNCETFTMPAGSMSAVSSVPTTEVNVYGNTAAAENDPQGWLFNRDVTTATEFEFNSDQATLGDGSLYVLPIQNDSAFGNADKFIAEYFAREAIADFESLSYDFLISGPLGDAADANKFYVNFYTTLADDTTYYNCRFDFVPSTGSVSSFTTFSVDKNTVATNTAGASCPVSKTLNDMAGGSYIRAIAISLGDTTGSDQDVGGYFDNVVFSTNSETTVYDFEPPFSETGVITNPANDGDEVSGEVVLAATYDDGDAVNDDAVLWAVRKDTCNAGTNTVWGNVDTHNDPYTWDGAMFESTYDSAQNDDGEYCFVFNPTDDNVDVRLTRTFVTDNYVSNKNECKHGGWTRGLFDGTDFRNQGQCVKHFAANDNGHSHGGHHNNHWWSWFSKFKWHWGWSWGWGWFR